MSAHIDDDDEETLSPLLKLPEGAPNYITPQGHQRLKAEFEELLKHERPKMVEVVSWAAGNGDRSENGDYIYGKRRLREIDRRLRFLTKRLDNTQVVNPLAQQGNAQIFFGATVTVADEEGVENTYTIVGVDETDASLGRISWISPLARVLIKAKEGDTVRFQSPHGVRELDIIEVAYQEIN